MKLLIASVVLVLGCHKGDKAEPAPGSATPSGSGSSATTAPGPVVTGSAASGSSAPETSSELAKAVDEFDRWLAPIWKLSDKERFQALCRSVEDLSAKADALRAMPNDAPDWKTTVEGLSMALGMARKCCLEQPKNLSPALQAGQDDTNSECIQPVHDGFASVVKLVPGAPAVDTHAGEPVRKK